MTDHLDEAERCIRNWEASELSEAIGHLIAHLRSQTPRAEERPEPPNWYCSSCNEQVCDGMPCPVCGRRLLRRDADPRKEEPRPSETVPRPLIVEHFVKALLEAKRQFGSPAHTGTEQVAVGSWWLSGDVEEGLRWLLDRVEPKPSEPVAEVSDWELEDCALEVCAQRARDRVFASGELIVPASVGNRALYNLGRASLAAENERLRAELAERERQIAELEKLLAVEQGIKDGRPPCTCGGEEPAFCDGCQDWCLVCRGDAMNGCAGCGGTGNGRDQRRIAALAMQGLVLASAPYQADAIPAELRTEGKG